MRRTVIAMLVLAALAAVFSLGTAAEAAPICNQTPPGTCRLAFNNGVGISSVLLKILGKDPSPTNPGGQNLTVRVCELTAPFDDPVRATVIRTASPKDIVSCQTPGAGVNTACSVTPAAKPATAASDTVFAIVQEVFGVADDTDDSIVEITAPGWDTLQVFVEDAQNATITTTRAVCP
jgi:cell division protein FtsW (lipid II flippase)